MNLFSAKKSGYIGTIIVRHISNPQQILSVSSMESSHCWYYTEDVCVCVCVCVKIYIPPFQRVVLRRPGTTGSPDCTWQHTHTLETGSPVVGVAPSAPAPAAGGSLSQALACLTAAATSGERAGASL